MSCVRHFWLGDVQTLNATDAINEAVGIGAFGTYESIPTKARGLLPEYGLATAFDGIAQRVNTLSGLTGTGGTFTLTALIRPTYVAVSGGQCIYQTGGTGSAYLGVDADGKAVFGVTNGTLIESAAALVAGSEYLLVGSYDGTEGTLFVGELVEDAVIAAVGPTALTFTGEHNLGTIGSNENTSYFTGALQGVAELNEALVLADVEALHATGIWTDITPDVEGPLTIDHGIHANGPTDRLSATGTCTFALDNSTLNSAALQGYYSPDHLNARTGFREGVPVRVALPDEGSPLGGPIQFIGTLKRAKIDAGVYLNRRVHCVCTDWMDEAARVKLKAITVKEDITADEVVGHILNAMRNRPHEIDLQAGSDTYVFALDNVEDNTSTAQNELRRVAMSELGLVYLRGNGTLVFEPRTARISDAAADYTLTELLDVEQERNTEQVVNLVKTTIHPRDSDNTLVALYELDALGSPAQAALPVDNGANIEFFLAFTDPNLRAERVAGVEVIEPVPTTDYLINTSADGSGVDLTPAADPYLTWRVGGNGVYLTVNNVYGQRVYITYLRIRGRGVYDYTPVTLQSRDDDSIDEHGEQAVEIDMPYQSDALVGQSAADYIRTLLSARRTHVKSITLKAVQSAVNTLVTRNGDISDRLAVSEDMSGVDGEFLVNAKKILWKEGDDVDVTFMLTPASTTTFWTLDVSALGSTTTLAPF